LTFPSKNFSNYGLWIMSYEFLGLDWFPIPSDCSAN